jgi:BlaI family transcriptional regulator, penicillinase repressor
MTLSHIHKQPFTDLQQAILNFIWSKGSATAEEVREAIMPKHSLKDSSVRTLLRRLESRGYLTHKLAGKVFVYRAKVQQRSVAARAVQQIIKRFCGGSVDQFLLGMVDEKVLSADEIRRLAKKIENSR